MLSVLFSSLVHAQLNNPNKLPQCPKPDYTKTHDVGIVGRTHKWNNCWGRYQVAINKDYKGDVIEGEWRNGLINGQGMYYYLGNNKFKGDKYVGEFKGGNRNGQGIYILANGGKYVGEFKDGDKHGIATMTLADGSWH